MAAFCGHVDAIKTLVDLRANVHAKDVHTNTPLHAAARCGHVDAMKTLVDLGADPGANGVFVLHPARPPAARRGAQPTVPESWNPRDTVEEENDLVKAARDAAAFAEAEARANRNMMQMIEQEERDEKKAEAAQAAAEARRKGKGKGKAGGGPCTKAAGSDEASTSKQGSHTRGTPPPVAHVAAATSGTQRPEPLSKKEKEKQRKERQRQAKIDTARKMMDVALDAIAEHGAGYGSGPFCGRDVRDASTTTLRTDKPDAPCPLCRESTMRTMQEALQEAHKYASRCEALAARIEEGRGVLQQARAEQARAMADAEAAAAAERLRLCERRVALARELQQMDSRLGHEAPLPQVEEEMLCVVCMDRRKQHAMVPCMHMCACEACAQRLLAARTPQCPGCRTPLQRSTRVFV